MPGFEPPLLRLQEKGRKNSFRTHTCGELRGLNTGHDVVLSGWVHNVRDFGGVVFMVLRDHYGIVQVIFPDPDTEMARTALACHPETVLRVEGTVRDRGEKDVNPKMATGEIEILATSVEILAPTEVVPFDVNKPGKIGESLRLEYRFLDLRR